MFSQGSCGGEGGGGGQVELAACNDSSAAGQVELAACNDSSAAGHAGPSNYGGEGGSGDEGACGDLGFASLLRDALRQGESDATGTSQGYSRDGQGGEGWSGEQGRTKSTAGVEGAGLGGLEGVLQDTASSSNMEAGEPHGEDNEWEGGSAQSMAERRRKQWWPLAPGTIEGAPLAPVDVLSHLAPPPPPPPPPTPPPPPPLPLLPQQLRRQQAGVGGDMGGAVPAVPLSIKLERMGLTDREVGMLADWCCMEGAERVCVLKLWLFDNRIGNAGALHVARIVELQAGIQEVRGLLIDLDCSLTWIALAACTPSPRPSRKGDRSTCPNLSLRSSDSALCLCSCISPIT